MGFCKYCGKQLGENQQCTCADAAADANDRIFSAAVPSVQRIPVQPVPLQQPGYVPQQPAEGFVQQDGSTAAAAQNSKKKTGIIIVAAALLLAVIGGLVWLLFLRGESDQNIPDYEKPVSQFFKGINQADYDLIADAVYTDHLFQYLGNGFFGSVSECKDYFSTFSERMTEDIEDFLEEAAEDLDADKVSYSYKISGKTRLDDDELRDIERDWDDFYGSDDLTAGYRLKIRVTFKADKKSDTATGYLKVVKTEDEGWKLVPESDDGFDFSRFREADDIFEYLDY